MNSEHAGELSAIPINATYAHWISDRQAVSLSTNLGAETLPFQGWRNFKEAFAPELVADAIRETEDVLGRRVAHIADPFGGSGTTALTSQFLGRSVSTIEVNPFLADLIEAKLARYDYDTLSKCYLKVLSGTPHDGGLPFLPPTFVPPGVKGRYLFHVGVAERIIGILGLIDNSSFDPSIRRLLRVVLVSCCMELSNAVISGKGRRYRSGWSQRLIRPSDVDDMFRSRMERVLYDVRRFGGRASHQYNLVRGDARMEVEHISDIDLAVFSPPYPNSFDYTDVYNIELWIGGYLQSSEDNRTLRSKTLRSHVQVKRSYEAAPHGSPQLTKTVSALAEVASQLWSSSIPRMVEAYFDDMRKVISTLKRKLSEDGRMYLVVGDSKYAGIPVPVASILSELALADGLRVIELRPFRSMRASPQQGGQAELAETLIVLGH